MLVSPNVNNWGGTFYRLDVILYQLCKNTKAKIWCAGICSQDQFDRSACCVCVVYFFFPSANQLQLQWLISK